MNAIKNMKLGGKITVGFAAVIALLFLTALTGYIGYNLISKDFVQYRVITHQDTLGGQIQSNLLESRLAFKGFVQTGNEAQHLIYDEKYEKMNAAIIALRDSLKDGDSKLLIEKIYKDAEDYKDNFDKIIEFKAERDRLYGIMNEKGPAAEAGLTQTAQDMYAAKAIESVYSLDMARKHLLLARLRAARFLESNDFNEVTQGEREFQEFDRWMNSAMAASNTASAAKVLEQVIADKEVYYKAFLDMASLIEKRNNTISYMDELGPRITGNAEAIKASLVKQQESFGPLVNSNIQLLTTVIVVFAFLALLLSIYITIKITALVVKPVETVTNTFKEIAHGEADLAVRLKLGSDDEIGLMSLYFNEFMEQLQDIMQHNKHQAWLKAGQAELNDYIRGEQNLCEISTRVITYAAKYIDAQIGALYVKEEDGNYKLYGSYAYGNTDMQKNIVLGNGLIGQAILEKRCIVTKDLPQDYVKINSGVGESLARELIIIPCISNHEVKCAMEFGLFHEHAPIQLEFLKLISESIAIIINAAIVRSKADTLLEKTLEQAEELQVQQEELRQSNEELEEQAKALRASEAHLQSQQEELRVMNEELSERTKSLETQTAETSQKNEYLKKAQQEIMNKADALEKASKYKSEFLANMSHELRTPLNSILVLSQLLADKTDSEPMTKKQLEFAKTINTAGSDLLKLINDILDISKVEAGKMTIHPEINNISEITKTMEANFLPIANEKQLPFDIKVNEDVPEVIETDRLRLQQILTNLLSNAFKFTHEGSVTLKLSTPDHDVYAKDGYNAANAVAFSVADTGIGIAAEKKEIIFEAFMQSDGTTSRKFGGTGLGLSISKELAGLLGGKIYLDSQEGVGSTFTLILPLVINKPQGAAPEPMDSKSTSRQGGHTAGIAAAEPAISTAVEEHRSPSAKTLLIIEDDHTFAEIMSGLAEEKGYRCIIARDGETGLQMVSEHRPSAIILDIGLPGMNGWEVIEALEANPLSANIPVHIISGAEFNKPKDSSDLIASFIKKPVDLQNLNHVLMNLETSKENLFKKLLVIGENEKFKAEIEDMQEGRSLELTHTDSGMEACNILLAEQFDCIILDMHLADMSGLNLLSKLRQDLKVNAPIIIYTDKIMSQDDEIILKKYAESIIIRGNKSTERLIAEVNLFLHDLDQKSNVKHVKPMKTVLEREEALKGNRILIIDDDMRNVFALSSILEDKGMKPIIGRNGKEGLEKLMSNPKIDLVLMDIMMPEMDGYTAIKEIRRHEKFKDLPIIALTAKAMKEDKQKCIEAGANDYLTKPIDIDKLISLLRVWLYK